MSRPLGSEKTVARALFATISNGVQVVHLFEVMVSTHRSELGLLRGKMAQVVLDALKGPKG